MDTMALRRQGSPQNVHLMNLSMFCFRVCLAAHCSGREAVVDLGRLGMRLKQLLEITRTANLVKRVFIVGADRLAGMGGVYIVMKSAADAGFLDKYSYSLAGTDPVVLKRFCQESLRQQMMLQDLLGDIVLPCSYSLARLPARMPLGALMTVCRRQRHLQTMTDLFSPVAEQEIPARRSLCRDVSTLASVARRLMEQNIWIDLVGAENVVITRDFGEPCVRIVDAELFPPELLDDVNPVIGKSYRQVFNEKLEHIERLVGDGSVATTY